MNISRQHNYCVVSVTQSQREYCLSSTHWSVHSSNYKHSRTLATLATSNTAYYCLTYTHTAEQNTLYQVVTGGTGCQHTVVTVVADEELQVDLVSPPQKWYYLTTAVHEHLLWMSPWGQLQQTQPSGFVEISLSCN